MLPALHEGEKMIAPLARRHVRLGLAASLVAGVAGAAACSSGSSSSKAAAGFAKDSSTLVYGVVPDRASVQQNYQPLRDYVEKISGLKVEYHEAADYTALIEAAVAGKIDIASFSAFTYVTARNNGAKITPFVSIILKAGQPPGYYWEAIAPAASAVSSIAEFAGKKVCFVTPTSTSGYLFPSYVLLKAGIDPQKGVTPVFAGKHDAAALKVSQGVECDVGFAEDSAVDDQPGLKVIAKAMVPGEPVVVSDALPAELKHKLMDGLKGLTIDQIRAAGIPGADSDAFKAVFHALSPVDDKYYDQIRDICKATRAPQCL
jgi:phosphonate transport system substrate-binding protein